MVLDAKSGKETSRGCRSCRHRRSAFRCPQRSPLRHLGGEGSGRHRPQAGQISSGREGRDRQVRARTPRSARRVTGSTSASPCRTTRRPPKSGCMRSSRPIQAVDEPRSHSAWHGARISPSIAPLYFPHNAGDTMSLTSCQSSWVSRRAGLDPGRACLSSGRTGSRPWRDPISRSTRKCSTPTTLFLTWQRDPTTTMTIQWIGRAKEADEPVIRYANRGNEKWSTGPTAERKPFPVVENRGTAADRANRSLDIPGGTDRPFTRGPSTSSASERCRRFIAFAPCPRRRPGRSRSCPAAIAASTCTPSTTTRSRRSKTRCSP